MDNTMKLVHGGYSTPLSLSLFVSPPFGDIVLFCILSKPTHDPVAGHFQGLYSYLTLLSPGESHETITMYGSRVRPCQRTGSQLRV